MSQPNILKLLTGLDKDDLKVYTELLRHGFGTPSFIAHYSGVKEKKIQEILAMLVSKNLAKQVPGAVPRYVPLRPYEELIKYLEGFHTEVVEAQNKFKDLDNAREIHFVQVSGDLNNHVGSLITQMDGKAGEKMHSVKKTLESSFQNLRTETQKVATDTPPRVQEALKSVVESFVDQSTAQGTTLEGHGRKLIDTTEQESKAIVDSNLAQMNQNKTDVHTQLDGFSKAIETNIQTTKGEIATQLTTFLGVIKKQLEDFLAALIQMKGVTKEQIEICLNQVQEILAATATNLKTQWDAFKAELKGKVELMTQQTVDLLKKFQSNLKAQLETTNTADGKSLEALRDQLITELQKLTQSYANSYADVSKSMEESTQQLSQSSGKFSGDLNDQLKAQITQKYQIAIAGIGQFIETARKDFQDGSQQNFNRLNNATTQLKEIVMTSVQQELERFKSEGSDALTKNVDAYVSTLDSQTDSFANLFKNQLNNYIADIDEIQRNKQKDLPPELHGTLTALVDKFKDVLEKMKNDLTENIQKEMVRFQGEAKDSLQNAQKAYVNQVEGQGEIYQRAFRDQVTKTMNTLNNELAQIINQIQTKTQSSLTSQTQTLNGIKDQTLDGIGKAITSWSNVIKSAIEGILAKFRDFHQKTQTEITQSLSNEGKQVVQLVNDSVAKRNQTLATNLNGLNSLTTDTAAQVTNSLLAAADPLISGLDTQFTTMNGILTEKYTTLEGNLMKSFEEKITIPEKDTSVIDTTVNAERDRLQGAVEALKANTLTLIATNTVKWEKLMQDIIPTINSKLTTTKTDLQNKLTEILKQINEYQVNLEETFHTAVTGAGTKAAEELAKIEGEVKVGMDSVSSQIESTFKEFQSSLATATKNMLNSTNENLAGAQTAIRTKILEIFGQAAEILNKIVSNSGKPLRILKDSWNDLLSSNLLSVENTWIINGLDPCLNMIYEIIGRAKRTVKIIMPEFDRLDMKELIDRQKKGLTVSIITNTELANKNKPEKAVEKDIQVFHSPENDLIAVIRDGTEELLLAPQPQTVSSEVTSVGGVELSGESPKKTDEVVGIVSLLPSFVYRVGRYVEFVQGNAKQVPKKQ